MNNFDHIRAQLLRIYIGNDYLTLFIGFFLRSNGPRPYGYNQWPGIWRLDFSQCLPGIYGSHHFDDSVIVKSNSDAVLEQLRF